MSHEVVPVLIAEVATLRAKLEKSEATNVKLQADLAAARGALSASIKEAEDTACTFKMGAAHVALLRVASFIHHRLAALSPRPEAEVDDSCECCVHWHPQDGGECSKYFISVKRDERYPCTWRREHFKPAPPAKCECKLNDFERASFGSICGFCGKPCGKGEEKP